MAAVLHLSLYPSRRLGTALLVGHALAAGALMPLVLPLAGKLALGGVVLASLMWGVRRRTGGTVGLRLREDGECELEARDGTHRTGRVAPSTFVSPWLTVLHVQLPEGPLCTVLILPDGMDPDDFRRLRVWLRWRVRP